MSLISWWVWSWSICNEVHHYSPGKGGTYVSHEDRAWKAIEIIAVWKNSLREFLTNVRVMITIPHKTRQIKVWHCDWSWITYQPYNSQHCMNWLENPPTYTYLPPPLSPFSGHYLTSTHIKYHCSRFWIIFDKCSLWKLWSNKSLILNIKKLFSLLNLLYRLFMVRKQTWRNQVTSLILT